MNKRKINYTKLLILILIIWNIFLSIHIYKPQTTDSTQTDKINISQSDNIKSAILDYSVAEIPEINITEEINMEKLEK
jgi:predicted transglutaminase-like protease